MYRVSYTARVNGLEQEFHHLCVTWDDAQDEKRYAESVEAWDITIDDYDTIDQEE